MVNTPIPFITCDPISLSEKLKSNRLPVVVSGKRKTEENLIFHNNFIQCSTEKFSIFAQHFGGKICVFVATTCFVLPLSTTCCLLEIFKVPLALTVKKPIVHFEGRPEFKWSDLGEQYVVGQGLFVAVFGTKYP